jgi:hypothetical protein
VVVLVAVFGLVYLTTWFSDERTHALTEPGPGDFVVGIGEAWLGRLDTIARGDLAEFHALWGFFRLAAAGHLEAGAWKDSGVYFVAGVGVLRWVWVLARCIGRIDLQFPFSSWWFDQLRDFVAGAWHNRFGTRTRHV